MLFHWQKSLSLFNEPLTGLSSGLPIVGSLIESLHLLLISTALTGMCLRRMSTKLNLLFECFVTVAAPNHFRLKQSGGGCVSLFDSEGVDLL